MKCQRCANELPGGAQFCMSCGTPVLAATPVGGINYSRPVVAAAPPTTNKKLIAGITAGFLLLALALFFGYRMLTDRTAKVPDGSRVVDAPAVTPTGSGLVDKNARVEAPGPLTDRSAVPDTPAPKPVDVIDYLRFLKEIERQRVTLQRKQLAELLGMSSKLTLLGVDSAIESGEPEVGARKAATDFQNSMNQWTLDWQHLSRTFASRRAPQSCQKLQNSYYDLLGKTSGAIASVGNSFSQAMSGNPQAALDSLTGMRGSGMGTPSRDVTEACETADRDLGDVCDRFKITKDFSILDDGGGANLLGR